LFTTTQKLTHAIVEAAKALGGSFKLVTLAPKTVREMTQLPRKRSVQAALSYRRKPVDETTFLDIWYI